MATSFVFFESFGEAAKQLDDEMRLQFYDALYSYGIYGEIPENINSAVRALVIVCAANIDANNKRREDGKRGGRPRKDAEETTPTDEEKKGGFETSKGGFPNSKPNGNGNGNVNGNGNNNGNVNGKEEKSKPEKKSRFTPPTPTEITNYCHEKGYTFDTNRFYDYYESNGWMVGKNKMRDWKAAVRSWASREREHPPNRQSSMDIFAEYMTGDNVS